MSIQIRSTMQQETEHYIIVSLDRLCNLMHDISNLNLIMYQFLFVKMGIPINLFTRRLFNNMRYGLGEYFLDDMRTLLDRSSRVQVVRINDFIHYITTNRSNPNFHHMIAAYNN